jgi:zinc protease
MNQQEPFRQKAPTPLPPRPIHIPRASETILSNGLTVVIVEDTRLPLVSYRLAFRAGDAHDPPELPGLTDLVTGLLTEGTESLTSRQIADEVGRMGATLSSGANSDYTTVGASSLATFSDNILDLVADVTRHPSFPENEVELIKQNTKESLRQQRAQPSFLATEMVSRVVFGEHPYSVIAPTLESLDATTRERIVEFHRSKFLPNNAVLVVAGDVRSDALLKRIEGLFGDWQPGEAPNDDFPAPPLRTSRSAYLVDRPGSAQSNIVIANTGITRTSPDYFPMLLMHTVLGANASSRLFMNLREDKGYTYGAYSSLDARRTAGTFRASAEVRTLVTGDSLKEFFCELERIRTEPVSKKEISDAKSYLTGVFPLRLETQEGLIDQLVQIKMFGLPDDYLETYRQRIQAATIEEIQEVATKYVKPDEAAIIIVGDGAETLEQLKPYTDSIELYNTAGKRKEKASAPSDSKGEPDAQLILGNWAVDIQTPFGQSIPAALTVVQTEAGLGGSVASEMGDANIVSAAIAGNSFKATLSFEMGGQALAAQIIGEVEGKQMEGSINLQDSPPLPFTANKTS